MQIAIQRPIGDEGVRVVGCAAQDGIEPRMIKALAPVLIDGRLGKLLDRIWQVQLIHLTDRHNILILQGGIVRTGTSIRSNQGNVQPIVGALAEQGSRRQNDHARTSGGSCS